MSEFKKLENRLQRWIRQAAGIYETELSPGPGDSVWGEFGQKHELPIELQRLLADQDPQSEEDPPPLGSSPLESDFLRDLFRPVLKRIDDLEKELHQMREEMNELKTASRTSSRKSSSGKQTSSKSKSAKATGAKSSKQTKAVSRRKSGVSKSTKSTQSKTRKTSSKASGQSK